MASPAAKPRPPPASLAGLPGSAAGCGGEAGPARGGPREPHVPAGPTHMCGAAGRRRASPGSHLWPHGGQSAGGGRGRPQHSLCQGWAQRGGPPLPLPFLPMFLGPSHRPSSPGRGLRRPEPGGLATGGPRSRAESALDCVASGKPCPSLGLGGARPSLGAGPADRLPSPFRLGQGGQGTDALWPLSML